MQIADDYDDEARSVPVDSTKTVYCSGPLFSPEEIAAMALISSVLEAAGYRTFVPHRDGIERFVLQQTKSPGPNLPGAALTSRRVSQLIFALDIYQVVEACDAVVFNMNGRVPDEGAVAEAAVAFSCGTPLVIYKNDARSAFNGFDNAMILGLSDAFATVPSVDELPAEVDRSIREADAHGSGPYAGHPPPPQVQAVIDRGRRIWNILKRLPDPKTDTEVQMVLEELTDIPDDAGTSAGTGGEHRAPRVP